MVRFLTRKALRLVIIFYVGFLFFCSPVFGTTYVFQSPGQPGEEGVLTGSITFDPDAVRESLEKNDDSVFGGTSLSLEDLGKNSNFSFAYTSPHSGVKHSEDTICNRYIYDLDNGLPENQKIGGKEGPFFDFVDAFTLYSIDFTSCVGKKGDIDSSISDRDYKVVYSELESQFNRLKLVEQNAVSEKPPIFMRKLPINLKLVPDKA